MRNVNRFEIWQRSDKLFYVWDNERSVWFGGVSTREMAEQSPVPKI